MSELKRGSCSPVKQNETVTSHMTFVLCVDIANLRGAPNGADIGRWYVGQTALMRSAS